MPSQEDPSLRYLGDVPIGFLEEKPPAKNDIDVFFVHHTVDGRNPAPPGMYKTL